jgi:hypothetical protein
VFASSVLDASGNAVEDNATDESDDVECPVRLGRRSAGTTGLRRTVDTPERHDRTPTSDAN